jgi:hypothetical protein
MAKFVGQPAYWLFYAGVSMIEDPSIFCCQRKALALLKMMYEISYSYSIG